MTRKAVTQMESAPSPKSISADVKAGFLTGNHDDLLRPFIVHAKPILGLQDSQRKSSPSESKAAETNRVARGIIAEETEKRDEKRRRLRTARLERNATEKLKAKPGTTPGRKASSSKSATR